MAAAIILIKETFKEYNKNRNKNTLKLFVYLDLFSPFSKQTNTSDNERNFQITENISYTYINDTVH